MHMNKVNSLILSVSWQPVGAHQFPVRLEWVMVALLCLLTLYLVLRSANFILSRLYWTSWKPATAMMGLLIAAYACKKAVDIPVSSSQGQTASKASIRLLDPAFDTYKQAAETQYDNRIHYVASNGLISGE